MGALLMELVACQKEKETKKVMEDIQKVMEDTVMAALPMVIHDIPLEVFQKQNSIGWLQLDHQVYMGKINDMVDD